MGKRWTPEEENYLRDNWDSDLTLEYLSGVLGRTQGAISVKAQRLKITSEKRRDAPMSQETWSEEDRLMLEYKWGFVKIKSLADKFQRSEGAIRRQAHNLHLGPAYSNTIYISKTRISEVMNITLEKTDKWIDEFDLPIKERTLHKRTLLMIRIDVLLCWLKEHSDLWNANKVEMYAFGDEPDWLLEKRKKDKTDKTMRRGEWTKSEDAKVILYHEVGLMQKDIAKKLKRTTPSINHRVAFLKKQGKINSEDSIIWTAEEEKRLEELFYNGLSKKRISEVMSKPINSVYYRLFKLKIHKDINYWNVTDENTLIGFCKEGLLKYKEMGNKLNRSRSSVENKIRKLKEEGRF